MHLPVTTTMGFTVRVANGEGLECNEKYERVAMQLQDFGFTVTLPGLSLKGLGVVLGVQWLESFGPVLYRLRTLTMEFKWQDKDFALTGPHAGPLQHVSI